MNTVATSTSDSVLVRVLRYNEDRKARYVRLKLKRMAADPFSFFRGADHLYADAWENLHPPDVGPEIPICGDLHLENFGAYRDDTGEYRYDINDFDEAVVAPCSLDVVRCATSIYLAAELWHLTPLQASGMVLVFLDRYYTTVTAPVSLRAQDSDAFRIARGPIWDLLGKTAMGEQAELLDRHTERHRNGTRRIVRSKTRHPEIKGARAEEVMAAVRAYGKDRGRADYFEPLDVTGSIAGIGSLGLERYTVLVTGGGSAETNCLLDLKEVRPSALRACSSRPWPYPDPSDAARVVRAEQILLARPQAGLDVLPVDDKPFRVREMIPVENRSSIDRFQNKAAKLKLAIEAAGQLTGRSHRRGAAALPDGDASEALSRWATGSALDSVLAAAARYAEATRLDHRQFRAELRAPDALPGEFRRLIGR
jgi:uncharacterized protein (DUF2252 family)